jgi:CHAT domain-containing protein
MQMLIGRDDPHLTDGLISSQFLGRPYQLQQLLPDVLSLLGRQLMSPLAARLRRLRAKEVTLIPGGRLNLLPLHAATYFVNGQPQAFIDEFTVRYAPSAQIAAACRARVRTRTAIPGLLAVSQSRLAPDGPIGLPYAATEVEAIAALFPGPVVKINETATPAAVLASMKGKTHLHFACHAEYGLEDPLDSGLTLADGTKLTLEMLMNEPHLDGAPLVVLSACQTALIDAANLPDEVIGLPAGFLSSGAGGVVGTLWPVKDRSTELLMAHFYTSLLADVKRADPAVALRQAQRWLRGASRADLAAYYERRIRDGDYEAGDAHRDIVGQGEPEEKPFASPYYWAAFTYTGA